MPVKSNCRNSRGARASTPTLSLPRAEPMRRYVHPIPAPAVSPPEGAAPVSASGEGAALTEVLERLDLQSQLLVDLLGAVNGLAAAVLARSGPDRS